MAASKVRQLLQGQQSAERAMGPQVMVVTPEFAAEIMAHPENRNRPLNPKTLATLDRALQNDAWGFSPAAICITRDGRCLNGQHRLTRIAKGGKAVQALVWLGCPEDLRHEERGTAWTLEDELGTAGVPDHRTVANVARWALRYEFLKPGKWLPSIGSTTMYAVPDQLAWCTNGRTDQLQEAGRVAKRGQLAEITIGAGPGGMLRYYTVGVDLARSSAFFEALSSGGGSHEAVMKCRRMLTKHKIDIAAQKKAGSAPGTRAWEVEAFLFVSAWNAYCGASPVRSIRIPQLTEFVPFPAIHGRAPRLGGI